MQEPFRKLVLEAGLSLTTGDRNQMYGEPVQNMQDIAHLWQAYLDGRMKNSEGHLRLTGEDVAHMCTLMKMARSFQRVMHVDNYIDAATYQAIAAECGNDERNSGSQ